MAYCSNCGHQLAEGAKFCYECGAKVHASDIPSSEKRKIIFDGEIHKCPNCGDILDAHEVVCDTCGYELRGASASTVVHDFSLKIANADNVATKEELIRNFCVPNTKEDIAEFFILAISNIETDADCRTAWAAKMEQTYQKARLTFGKSDEFAYFEELYQKSQKSIKKKRVINTIFKTIAQSKKLPVVLLGVVGVILMIIGIASDLNYTLIMLGLMLIIFTLTLGDNKK